MTYFSTCCGPPGEDRYTLTAATNTAKAKRLPQPKDEAEFSLLLFLAQSELIFSAAALGRPRPNLDHAHTSPS